MPETMKWLGFVAGLVIVAGTWGSVVRTLVLPRGLSSRLGVFVGRRMVRGFFLALANRFESYEAKDRILALSGPATLLAILVTWLSLFLLGYALLLWPLIGFSFAAALRESGSSMLTLGFAGTPAPAATGVNFAAATTGVVVIALQVAYLPTLYAAFNRRETLVTMLQSRGGSPAWGPEILWRAKQVNLADSLPELYLEWERWAADVAESHSTHPVLVWFRSPHPLRSWVVGLLAVMDSAALYLALAASRAPSEARLCLRMGFTCLRDIAGALGIRYDPDPLPDDPIQLTYEEFAAGVQRIQQAGFPIERSVEEAWPDFRGWRVNYERLCYVLADQVVAVPGPWSGDRTHLPGMAIIPQRPADRRPQPPMTTATPKARSRGKA
jgi:hypothetical protein